MHQSFNLSTNAVVEAAHRVDVNKAVSDPFSGSDGVANFIDKIKTSINTILWRNLPHSNCLGGDFRVERKHVSRSFTSNQDHVAAVRPVDFFRNDINLTNKGTTVPVVEENGRIAGLHSDHVSSIQAFCGRGGGHNGLCFLEVFENLDTIDSFTNGIVSSTSTRPNKVQSLPESLVSQGLGGVDDEFTITAHGNKPTVAIVLEHLWEKFARSQITRDDW
mmetsp:Transcript_38603/g.80204  ORF Transcript_38603/g.80204 Transcript_38603/m.80204 type:complete len:219 (+) Transcript_38603:1334-1990(+)